VGTVPLTSTVTAMASVYHFLLCAVTVGSGDAMDDGVVVVGGVAMVVGIVGVSLTPVVVVIAVGVVGSIVNVVEFVVFVVMVCGASDDVGIVIGAASGGSVGGVLSVTKVMTSFFVINSLPGS
jgi:hypothetical protein